jgi:hypothetical protein
MHETDNTMTDTTDGSSTTTSTTEDATTSMTDETIMSTIDETTEDATTAEETDSSPQSRTRHTSDGSSANVPISVLIPAAVPHPPTTPPPQPPSASNATGRDRQSQLLLVSLLENVCTLYDKRPERHRLLVCTSYSVSIRFQKS